MYSIKIFTSGFDDPPSFHAKGLRAARQNRNFKPVFDDRLSFWAKLSRFVIVRGHRPHLKREEKLADEREPERSQTDRQTDRQTERERERERRKEIEEMSNEDGLSQFLFLEDPTLGRSREQLISTCFWRNLLCWQTKQIPKFCLNILESNS